jgi:chorismate dehydratase
MFSVLASRQVDAAIVPVVDYLDTPGLDMVDGLGICADGNVESVLLQCKCPLEKVEVVNLDPASKTSNMLVKLLLKQHFCIRREIHFRIGAPEADACVVIGDRALRVKPALKSYDLAAEWKSMTGLPFVFAVWAHWKDCPDSRRLSGILHVAKNAGCKAIVELSNLYAKRAGLSEARCRHYLTSCIHYDLGPAEKRGMRLFHELYKNLTVTYKQTLKEESIQTRRIIRNERKSRAIEPILNRFR